jgi:hypothetical protein
MCPHVIAASLSEASEGAAVTVGLGVTVAVTGVGEVFVAVVLLALLL